VILNKEYAALIIVSASWVYFVGANLVFALSKGRIQDSPLLLPDGGDTRINAWPKRDQCIEKSDSDNGVFFGGNRLIEPQRDSVPKLWVVATPLPWAELRSPLWGHNYFTLT